MDIRRKKQRSSKDDFSRCYNYIEPNIIAVQFPSDKEGDRNYITKILRFLVEKHKDRYKIYNLCLDESENPYDPSKFDDLVAHYSFDSNNPPLFALIMSYCEEMDRYLVYDKENMAIVHDMGDEGRTEVMICAYLVHKNLFKSCKETLEWYGQKKTSGKENVTTPSQRRYLYYYAHLRRHNLNYKPTVFLLLTNFVMENIPNVNNGTFLSFCIYQSETTAKVPSQKTYPMTEATRIFGFELADPLPLRGDVQVQFYYHCRNKKELMFQFWFNTFFVSGLDPRASEGEASMETQYPEKEVEYGYIEGTACRFELQKEDLEKGNKDKKNKIIPPNFKLVVNFIVPYTKQYKDKEEPVLASERDLLEQNKEERTSLRQQHEQSLSELCRAQEQIDGLRSRLAESEKRLNTERTTTRNLNSDVQMKSERLRRLQNEIQQKDAKLKSEKASKVQTLASLRNLRIEYQENLRRSNEDRTRLRQQLDESESARRSEALRHEAQTTNVEHRQDWTIPRHEIEISETELGSGGWGWVKEGKFRETKIAVKQMHEIIMSSHNREKFEREMKIAAKCRHPNLLQFIGATNDDNLALFVTELLDTDLRTVLGQRSLQHDEVLTVSLDVSLALNYLHLSDPPIVHRDISSANVLLWKRDKEWRAKLSDYGSANFMQQCDTPCPGAVMYSAPEASTSTQQSPKMDVYSYGVLVCEMCISRKHTDPQSKRPQSIHQQISLITNNVLQDLVLRCTNKEPENRPTMQDVLLILQRERIRD